VVLCFFQENDFWDNVTCGLYSIEGDSLIKHDAPRSSGRTLQRITRWIPGYNTLFARSHLLMFIKWRTARYHYRDLGERFIREKDDAAIEKEESKLTRALLLALKDACDRIDCRLVLTAIPSSTRDWTLRETTLDLLGFAKANGVAYVDIQEPMAREASAGADLVYPIDGHWTREGHKLAGGILSQFFLTNGVGRSAPVESETS
jgi:hypothetical protein